jgi:hypothetical protein
MFYGKKCLLKKCPALMSHISSGWRCQGGGPRANGHAYENGDETVIKIRAMEVTVMRPCAHYSPHWRRDWHWWCGSQGSVQFLQRRVQGNCWGATIELQQIPSGFRLFCIFEYLGMPMLKRFFSLLWNFWPRYTLHCAILALPILKWLCWNSTMQRQKSRVAHKEKE